MVLNKEHAKASGSNTHFNLVEEPWIPVRQDGQHGLVGLDELFRTASCIQDLDCAPHERIALLRLLVCITHAALGAPESPEEWDDFGASMATKVPEYLACPDIKPHFNLLGDGPRFLQVPMAKTKQCPLLEFLELKFANGPAFLDHTAGIPKESPPERLALNLLCFQNFFIGGGMGSPKNGGVLGNGPSLKFLHTYLLGTFLSETIVLNCLLREYISPIGCPPWTTVGQASPFEILSRLAPMPCHVWLGPTTMKISQGMEYPMEEGTGPGRKLMFRDPFATSVRRGDRNGLLRAEVAKALWRDLHLFLELRQISQGGELAAPRNILSHVSSLREKGVTLWAGELIKHEKKAIVIDAIESTFTVPSAMLGEEGRAIYQRGVACADSHSKSLEDAVKTYGKALNIKSAPVRRALSRYWHTLDRDSPLLLDLVGKPMPIAFDEKGNAWGDLVRGAARDAYEATCPRQTPRQIQAFAAGLKKLPVPKPKPKST